MKLKTVFICENCGFNSTKWLGKCPDCEAWNSFHEDVVAKNSARTHQGIEQNPVPLSEAKNVETRIPTKIGELDRVLGGGIIDGSLILLSGEPGIGKSTLTLKICEGVNKKSLYISGEESLDQISLRAKRMGINSEQIQILGETNIENILKTLNAAKPEFVVVDSVQVMSCAEVPSLAGTVSQVRAVTETLMNYAKNSGTPVLIIGHVTKEGNLAGPKMLEHLVDTVLLIEGDRYQHLRVLRSVKNRFGSTNEVGLFEMGEKGLEEVADASKKFLEGRKEDASGSVITTVVEGTRPLLLEIQALTNTTPFGYPKRAASGYDANRLQLLLAVIQKHLKINVADKDIYVNVVGGFKVNDPSTDLAVIMAIISSLKQTPLPKDTVFMGEVGLSGELRTIPHITKRLNEATKIGFEKIYIPSSKDKSPKATELKDISEALNTLKLTSKKN